MGPAAACVIMNPVVSRFYRIPASSIRWPDKPIMHLPVTNNSVTYQNVSSNIINPPTLGYGQIMEETNWLESRVESWRWVGCPWLKDGIQRSFHNKVWPSSIICQCEPTTITSLPPKRLYQAQEALLPRFASMNEQSGKYRHLRTWAQRELGSLIRRQHYFPRRAKFNSLRF